MSKINEVNSIFETFLMRVGLLLCIEITILLLDDCADMFLSCTTEHVLFMTGDNSNGMSSKLL